MMMMMMMIQSRLSHRTLRSAACCTVFTACIERGGGRRFKLMSTVTWVTNHVDDHQAMDGRTDGRTVRVRGCTAAAVSTIDGPTLLPPLLVQSDLIDRGTAAKSDFLCSIESSSSSHPTIAADAVATSTCLYCQYTNQPNCYLLLLFLLLYVFVVVIVDEGGRRKKKADLVFVIHFLPLLLFCSSDSFVLWMAFFLLLCFREGGNRSTTHDTMLQPRYNNYIQDEDELDHR